MSEKVVLNGVDLTFYIIILFRGNTNKFFKIRRHRHSAGYGKRHSVRLFRKAERTAELALEQAYHSDAVFKLRVLLVEIIIRQLSLRADIHFVRAEEYPRAVLFYALITKGRDHIYRLSRVLGRKRLERIQTLAVFRKSDRDNRHAVHCRIHVRKILHSLHKRLSVVKAGAADDLAVHDYAAAGKAAHYIDAFTSIFIAQKLHAKLGIGRMNGDVHRAYVQVDYAL